MATQLYNSSTNEKIYPNITKDCLSAELQTYLTENAAVKLSTGKEDIKASKLIINEDVGFKLTNNAGMCTLGLTIGTGIMATGGKLSCSIVAGTGIAVSVEDNGTYVIAIKEQATAASLTQQYDLTPSSLEDEQIQ